MRGDAQRRGGGRPSCRHPLPRFSVGIVFSHLDSRERLSLFRERGYINITITNIIIVTIIIIINNIIIILTSSSLSLFIIIISIIVIIFIIITIIIIDFLSLRFRITVISNWILFLIYFNLFEIKSFIVCCYFSFTHVL
jgi:hypothetical protein